MTITSKATMTASFFKKYSELLLCPHCLKDIGLHGDEIACCNCHSTFPMEENGIVQLFAPNAWDEKSSDVTKVIKEFYETTPFPNYDDMDDVGTLVHKASNSYFPKLLFDQIPFGAKVLECGCGTGQLTNYLSIGNREVIGTDLCMNSLKLAQDFREQNSPTLDNAGFLQMNLFQPCFKPGSFDVVISNGCLHHTSDPKLGFETISRLVRPGGYLIIGLYHKYARLLTDLRRGTFNITRDRLLFLDKLNIKKSSSQARKNAWFRDQYKNPHESKHTIKEVMSWVDDAGLKFVKSFPKTGIAEPIRSDEAVFEDEAPAGTFETAIKEFSTTFFNSKEGGFFTIIARRPS
jgi:SAM-dependent methyltransferase